MPHVEFLTPMALILELVSIFLQAWLCFLIALLLTLLVLAAVPNIEITPPEPEEVAQPEPIRQRRGPRRQLYY